jgi:hypothetical protein
MISLAFHVDNSKLHIFDICLCFQGREHRWKLYHCSADIYNTVSLNVYIDTVFWRFCILFGVGGFTLGLHCLYREAYRFLFIAVAR